MAMRYKLGLGRAKKPKYRQSWRIVLGTCVRKGDILVSRVEYEFWSSVVTLEGYVGILADVSYFPDRVGEALSC